MKKTYKYLLLVLVCAFSFGSCTDLDEDVYSDAEQSKFGNTPEEVNALIGPAYTTLRNYVGNQSFWWTQISTDEFMIPARGDDWLSGGIHLRFHTHEWSPKETPNMWKFNEVVAVNKIIDLLDNTTAQINDKDRIYAELKTIRAFWYFVMLDNIGNVPIVTTFEASLPKNNTRKEVYDFVEKELLDALPHLSVEKNSKTYTKATKWVAHSILAKLYLNAQVYTGIPQWQKCIDQCEFVIGSTLYTLEPNIFNNFKVDNSGSTENIWSLPYQDSYFMGYFMPYQMSWHYNSKLTFGTAYSSWNGPCAVPSFVHKFDPDDVRLGSFLIGLQYDMSGNPILLRDGSTHLDYTVDMGNFANAKENEGARLFKWEVEKGGNSHMNNDFAIFRYSDILLMKAECLLRQGNEPDARTIVNNDIRARNFSPAKPLPLLTLDLLLDERGFEFVFEGWRRNDQIRFDKFGGTWSFKPDADPADKHTYLFPIPQSEMDKNPNLKQNPGYPTK